MNQQNTMAGKTAADLVQAIATQLYSDAGAGVTDLIALNNLITHQSAQLVPSNPLLTVARRNIRQFLAKASLASEMDLFAAGQCVDLMEAAIDAPHAQAVDLGRPLHCIRLINIPARSNLDPIDVFVQDYEIGRGRIVVTCYGQAWCGFWGAMGDRTVMQFVASCSADYVAGNMLSGRHDFTSDDERIYVVRIATEVITEFRALIDGQAVDNG